MKSIILLLVLSNTLYAQTYGSLDDNKGADHGVAKNYSWSNSNGIPIVPFVRSEIEVNGQTYSYIRTGLMDFKLARKQGDKFSDIIPKLMAASSGANMGEYSRLLHVYEDEKIVNIYSWGIMGYQFNFYQKKANRQTQLIRAGYIPNTMHSVLAFDETIASIEFSGASQITITKKPAVVGAKKDNFEFISPGVYEFRPDGVYRDGVFDPSVQDREPQDVINENRQKDPRHYIKRNEIHAARVASYTKEIMDAEAARVAALAPQPTPKPSVNSTPPEPNPEPAVAPSPIPKTPTATTEAESSSNLTPWLAGIVALFVILLGYLGLRFIRKKTKS